MKKYDFGGWATKNDLRCSDGLTIVKNAFEDNNGRTVPLIWNHDHNSPENVLGHAMLENREEGVYAYCTLNETPTAKIAAEMIKHGDIEALSIYANKLQKNGPYVMHGQIREVSLVLAGANPGAFIDNVMIHGECADDEGILYTGEVLEHGDCDPKKKKELEHGKEGEEVKMDKKVEEKTIADVFETFTDEQKDVVYAIVGAAVEEEKNKSGNEQDKNKDVKDDENMKHNVFNKDKQQNDVLTHSEMEAIFSDGKRYGSLKDAALAHGITNIDYLFPDAKNVTDTPQFIKRPDTWVDKVLGSVHHTPFSRIKSLLADITADDARAKGYIKGKLKKDEVFTLLKRTTTPTTIYKKQKLDRDDAVDITDFDVVAWLKTEMRMMLNEEIARAILIGDGRSSSSDDKINEQNIRPIVSDDNLYAVHGTYTETLPDDASEDAKSFINSCIRLRKEYQGSGDPTLYTSQSMLTEMLLLTDTTGRALYDDVNKIASKLMVKEIVTIPAFDNSTRTDNGKTLSVKGIIVNLVDYNIGADKGGAVNMFDDFDIDYNAQKYLIETRCSGALVKPKSAMVIETEESSL